jgi:ssRNA-specific RNase YbeY (16S rRNA maturation enzyme)
MILDKETALIFQINEEEKATQLKLLGEVFVCIRVTVHRYY